MDALGRGFEKFTRFRDARIGGKGAENGVGGDSGFVHALVDGFEQGAKVAAAAREKSGGAGVAVDGGFVGDVVDARDDLGVAPAKEIVLDVFAVGVVANLAPAGVAGRD